VFAKEFGEEWESWLERFSLIQFILDFGEGGISNRISSRKS